MIQNNIPLNSLQRFTLELLDILELKNQCILMDDYGSADECRNREKKLLDSTDDSIIKAFNSDLRFIANNTGIQLDESRTSGFSTVKNIKNIRNLLTYYQSLRNNKINQILKKDE
jgi:hypothetical protein